MYYSSSYLYLDTKILDENHGTEGPVSVEDRSVNSQLAPTMRAAAAELGFNLIDDTPESQIGKSIQW